MSRIVGWAALSGAVAVAAGAYGAHGASGQAAELLRTGAEYQMIHAVAAIAVLRAGRSEWPAPLLLAGSVLFGGSLYALAFGAPGIVGIVTPLGGLGMIAGWIGLAFGAFRAPRLP